MLDLFYRFGSSPNWDGYCNLEVDKVVERQSTESDIEKRKRLARISHTGCFWAVVARCTAARVAVVG